MSAVIWFRKGLRLHDNPALLAAAATAAKTNGGALYPVFVLDPWFALAKKSRCCHLLHPLSLQHAFQSKLREVPAD